MIVVAAAAVNLLWVAAVAARARGRRGSAGILGLAVAFAAAQVALFAGLAAGGEIMPATATPSALDVGTTLWNMVIAPATVALHVVIAALRALRMTLGRIMGRG